MRFLYFFYVWIPAIVVGTLVILVLPWLAVVALAAVLLAAVAAVGSLAWATFAAVAGLVHSFLGRPREAAVPMAFYEQPRDATR